MNYKLVRYQLGTAPQTNPTPGEMWVFEDNGQVMGVDFLCPCGCGRTCYTPVVMSGQARMKDREWVFMEGPRGPSLSPSIRYTGGCKTHFTITDGEVVIHEDSGR